MNSWKWMMHWSLNFLHVTTQHIKFSDKIFIPLTTKKGRISFSGIGKARGHGPIALWDWKYPLLIWFLLWNFKEWPLEILNFFKNAANRPLSKFSSTPLLFMCLVFTGRLVCRDWESENGPLLMLCRFLLCLENCTMNITTITMEDDDFFQIKNMGYMPRTQQPTSYTKCIQNAKF